MKVRKNLANDFQSLCKTLKIRIVAANGYTSGKRVGNKIASQVRILFSPHKQRGWGLFAPTLAYKTE